MTDLLLTVGAAIVSGLVMFVFGYHSRAKVDKTKQLEKKLEDVKVAQEVREDVEALDDVGLADRASKWVSGKY